MADLNVKVYSMFWGFFAIFTFKRVASVKEKSAKNKKKYFDIYTEAGMSSHC